MLTYMKIITSLIHLLKIVFFIIPQISFADWVYNAEGRFDLPKNISENESCYNAKIEAKKNAMMKAGLERGSFFTIDICLENENKSSCKLHQENQSYYEGGYINDIEIIEEKIVNTSNNKECLVVLNADITKFRSQHDPNYILEGNIKSKILKIGDEIILEGEVNQTSNIFLLSVSLDKNSYVKLLPNEFEKLENIEGKFSIPSLLNSSKYSLEAQFPINYNRTSISEFLILLVTKKSFRLLNEEKSNSFYKRLDELGRKNWRIRRIGYTIIKD